MLLKCADIGHLAADAETHKRWAYMLEEEFFQQVVAMYHVVTCTLCWQTQPVVPFTAAVHCKSV